MALHGARGGDPAFAQAPRIKKRHPVATALALAVGAVALVCAGLAVGTLHGPAALREYVPALADDLGILVEPEPELELLDDGLEGELARRVAAVSAELQRSAYDVPTLEEATAGALGGLVAATDPSAIYIAPEDLETGYYAGDPAELVASRLYGTVGVLTLERVEPGVAQVLAAHIEALVAQGAGAFVLDLRGNPGGSFNEGVAVASLFMEGGTVAEVADAAGRVERVSVNHGACVTQAPLAVLVDGGTGSAAELVAAALHDHARATLVGERTCGNGTVRSVKTLSFGGAVAYATGEFYTPDGNRVDGVGITPHVEVAPTAPLFDFLAVVELPAAEPQEPAAEEPVPAQDPSSEELAGAGEQGFSEDGAAAGEGAPAEVAEPAEQPEPAEPVYAIDIRDAAQVADALGLPHDPQLLAAIGLLAPELLVYQAYPIEPAQEELDLERQEETQRTQTQEPGPELGDVVAAQ